MSVKNWIIRWWVDNQLTKEADKMFGKNWKTNLAGYSVYLATLIAIIHCVTCKDCGSLYQCILLALAGGGTGTGLIVAKDSDVTGGTRKQ